MKKIALAFLLTGLFCLVSVSAQTTGKKTRPRIVETPTPTPQPVTKRPELKNSPESSNQNRKPPVLIDNTSKKSPTNDDAKVETDEIVDESNDEITIETNYVTLPVSVLDRNGRFISGLNQGDFQIFENGVQQKVEYFASIEVPFTVVLLLDVSPSTQYKIDEIQNAAISFVNQLRQNDQVMVVAFDENYSVLSRPTNNRSQLQAAIRRANFGSGTSIYDSVSRTISQELTRIEGRKAIVLFTDGVDTTSNRANYQSTIRQVEEVDALIYPIRYNTYGQYGSNTGGNSRGRTKKTGSILGDILTGIIIGGTTGGGSVNTGAAGTSREDYERGKQYLEELARYSGGRKFEADSVKNLDSAFQSIAEELRRQYSLGYYPETGEKGERRGIRVRVKRPNLVVRTKSSYIVGT